VDPEDPGDDDHGRHRGGDPDQLPERLVLEPIEDQRELQSDQHEQQRVEQEGQDRPHRVARHPLPCAGDLGRAPADVDADRHGREHARRAHALGRHVGRVAREDRDRDLHGRVVEPLADLRDHPPDREADGDPAGRAEHELQPGLRQRERAADRADRHAVDHQRSAVVDQALALDDRVQAAREPEPPADLDRGQRVRRRDDRPEREGRRPRQPVDQRVRHDRDRARRRDHEPDRHQGDRAQVVLEVAQAREERGAVEQRRQEDHEHELRLELDVRQAGDEAHHEPAEHEQDRIRDPDHPAGGRQHGDRDQQRDQDELDAVH
jgi:hypothetical protein